MTDRAFLQRLWESYVRLGKTLGSAEQEPCQTRQSAQYGFALFLGREVYPKMSFAGSIGRCRILSRQKGFEPAEVLK